MFDKDMCQECDGLNHDLYEPLKFVAHLRKWLCATCRNTLITATEALK